MAIIMNKLLSITLISSLIYSANAIGASVAYIHGRVADNGTVLEEGVGEPFDQMLITDSGRTGLSRFRQLVESQGHSINQFRDTSTNLDATFLDDYDVVIFGLHQKIWSPAEKAALDAWIQAGGGMFIYSDSASGGSFRLVPGRAQNTVGQTVTNNLIAQYGMQVTVDQADGVTAQLANSGTSISSIDALTLEGEGVSPIAVAENDPDVEILVPYQRNQTPLIRHTQNISIANPVYASLVIRPVGQGHVVAMFDRQPMWNDGPGSDIEEEDNTVILREMVNFLAVRPEVEGPSNPTPNPSPRPSNREATISPVLPLLLDDD